MTQDGFELVIFQVAGITGIFFYAWPRVTITSNALDIHSSYLFFKMWLNYVPTE